MPGRAAKIDPDVQPSLARADFEHLDRVDRDGARREIDRFTRPRGPVGGAAGDLPGAERRRPLLERADESGERIGDGPLRRQRSVDGDDRALRVIGGRGLAEADDGVVPLATAGQLLAEPGGGADEDREDAGREGVQGARVADPSRPGQPPHEADHVVAGRPDRLVEVNDPEHRRGRARARIPPERGASPHRAGRSRSLRRRGRGHRRRTPR